MSLFLGNLIRMAVGAQAEVSGKIQADLAASAANRSSKSVEELQARFDKLVLVCSALWELLKEKTNLTDEELVTKVRLVDEADGAADGRMKPSLSSCANCGRPLSAKHMTCMYCGAQRPDPKPFNQAL